MHLLLRIHVSIALRVQNLCCHSNGCSREHSFCYWFTRLGQDYVMSFLGVKKQVFFRDPATCEAGKDQRIQRAETLP